MEGLLKLWNDTGLANFEIGQIVMMAVGGLLLYLAIARGYEPLLLLPIGFGAVLANIPMAGFTDEGGLLWYVYHIGIETGVFPLLIFMGVGAMTDFGALIANPKMLFLGASAQFGIFATLFGAIALNLVPGFEFSLADASAIAIIGGADGPTAIFLASKLAPELRRHCGSCLFIHGIGTDYSATNHEGADDQRRALYRDGAVASGL